MTMRVDNVTAAFQQLLGEAPSRRGPVDVPRSLAETSRNLFTAAVAVVHQLHLMDRAHALPEVDALSSSIDRALAGAARPSTAELRTPPPRRRSRRLAPRGGGTGPFRAAGPAPRGSVRAQF